ncbi:hypothetical protein AU255_04975 [Methyloprofundus sedimenti]|uniref:Uncharacterized protein n=1 Tax=Methyloprofundus sedimenti TaxID=1420851 RepID=A0A1V8M6S3_9GAMM|nr:hypothetical protein [Methyloprofundus sedimenti]OQK17247.1 hypothetical protein AU255_04975 [Methyloprofundus sedimenti]
MKITLANKIEIKTTPDNEKLGGNKELARLQNDNDYLKSELKLIKKQVKDASGDREAKQALQKERDALLLHVAELERVAGITDAILNDKDTEIARLKGNQKPVN